MSHGRRDRREMPSGAHVLAPQVYQCIVCGTHNLVTHPHRRGNSAAPAPPTYSLAAFAVYQWRRVAGPAYPTRMTRQGHADVVVQTPFQQSIPAMDPYPAHVSAALGSWEAGTTHTPVAAYMSCGSGAWVGPAEVSWKWCNGRVFTATYAVDLAHKESLISSWLIGGEDAMLHLLNATQDHQLSLPLWEM